MNVTLLLIADSEDEEEQATRDGNDQSLGLHQLNTASAKTASSGKEEFDPAAFLKQMKEKSLRDMKSGGSSNVSVSAPKTITKKEVYEFAGEKVVYRLPHLTLLASRKRCKSQRLLHRLKFKQNRLLL